MPRPEFPIDVDRQLVWMTCGSDAGYQTLLSPAGSQASWYEVLESAFPGLEIGQQGVVKAAAVFHEGSPALALAFFDPARCDSSSRPVKHFLLLLGASDELIGKGPQLVTASLLAQLEPAYQVLWEATRYSREADIARDARKKMAGQTVFLDLSAKVTKPSKPKEKKVSAIRDSPARRMSRKRVRPWVSRAGRCGCWPRCWRWRAAWRRSWRAEADRRR